MKFVLLIFWLILWKWVRACSLEEKITRGTSYHNNRCLVEFAGKHVSALCILFKTVTATLILTIQGSTWSDTTIMSDLLTVYESIQAMGYSHVTIKYTNEFDDPVTGAHTHNMKNSWKNNKPRNKNQYRRNNTHHAMLDGY